MLNKLLDCEKAIKLNFIGNEEAIRVILAGVIAERNILIIGGHGVGKSTLCELIGKSLGVSFSRVQGTNALTESKFLARFHLGKLMQGVEEVEWKDFVTSEIKFVDEINRIPPYSLNSFFQILAENKVSFAGSEKKVKGVVIATMNPSDEGTYPLPKPFLDRFDLIVRINSLGSEEKKLLNKRFIENINPVLQGDDLNEIRKEVKKIELNPDVENYFFDVIRDLQLCVYDNKQEILNFPQPCETCPFKNYVCSKIEPSSTLGERLFRNINFLKAYSAISGETISKEMVMKLLPIMLEHRLEFNQAFISEFPTKRKALEDILNKINKKFEEREETFKMLKEFNETRSLKTLENLERFAKNDLLLKEKLQTLKNNIKNEATTQTPKTSQQNQKMILNEESFMQIAEKQGLKKEVENLLKDDFKIIQVKNNKIKLNFKVIEIKGKLYFEGNIEQNTTTPTKTINITY